MSKKFHPSCFRRNLFDKKPISIIFGRIVAEGIYYQIVIILLSYLWWRGTVVERRSLAGELSLSCARPAADG